MITLTPDQRIEVEAIVRAALAAAAPEIIRAALVAATRRPLPRR
jgi:hypothetical protein